MDASEKELVIARRWVGGALTAALVLLAVGIRHSPPVISVHSRRESTAARTEPSPQPEESTEQARGPAKQDRSLAPLWWLYFKP